MQRLAHIQLVVRDYDEAISFFCGVLGFNLIEDTYQPEQDKRWVVIGPDGGGTSLVLGKPSSPKQIEAIGNQSCGRVFLFLQTDDFDRDYQNYRDAGVTFVRSPRVMNYGTVAVFKDIYGNLWDLVEFAEGHPLAADSEA